MVKAIAIDVDGVLTDGTFWWDAAGAELKRFSFRDIMGISRASRAGVIFVGDDVNDLPAIGLAGFSAAPADAHQSVRDAVKLVTQHPGGNGAVREMLDYLNLCQ